MLVTPLLALGLSTALAGDPCKKAEIQEDPFTGETTLRIAFTGMAGELEDDTPTFTLRMVHDGVVDSDLPAGHSLDILTEAGEIVTLTSTSAAEGVSQASQYGAYTWWDVTFPLEPGQIDTLAASPVTNFRFTLLGKQQTPELAKKGGKRAQTIFACLDART